MPWSDKAYIPAEAKEAQAAQTEYAPPKPPSQQKRPHARPVLLPAPFITAI